MFRISLVGYCVSSFFMSVVMYVFNGQLLMCLFVYVLLTLFRFIFLYVCHSLVSPLFISFVIYVCL